MRPASHRTSTQASVRVGEILSGDRLAAGGPNADASMQCDVVIVGSGAGGSVAACQLAEAGLEVLVLEEGPYVEPAEYGGLRPSESLRRVWRDGALTAAVSLADSPVVNVTMGRCVGGSSVLTGGVCFRTPDEVLHAWQKERGLPHYGPDAMAPYFDEVERDVHVETVPTSMRSHSTVLFARGAERLGVTLDPIRRNTQGCNGCGQCNFGCPHGAKLSVDVSYLPRAIKRGARVVADAHVDRVLTHGGHATGVRGRFKNGGTFDVRARAVVLAAGAAHTPLLLARSGLGKRSGALGRHLTLHPSVRMMARFDESVRGWSGALQSAYSDAYFHEKLTLVSVFVPPSTVAAGLPGIGPAFMDRAGGIDRIAMFGGLIHDEGVGRVVRVPGREPLLHYPMARADRPALANAVRRMADIFFAAGARELYIPVLGHAPVDADAFRKLDIERISPRRYEVSSQHPLGTCRMGPDASTSVTDEHGRVWELPNLYVVDGSTVPTSLGVNPQITVMAIALRLSRGIATSL